jgi:AraC-like DNA-binding protein
MGIKKLMYVLLFVSFSAVFGVENVEAYNEKEISAFNIEQTSLDTKGNKEDAKKTQEAEEAQLTAIELKARAFDYAYAEEPAEAVEYIRAYIKNVLNVNILNHPNFDGIRYSQEFKDLEEDYTFKLNGWVVFLFSCGLIGIFLFVVLNLRKKGDFTSNILMSTFILIHSLFVIHAAIFMSHYNYQMPGSLYVTAIFSFLYGPLLYFYYRRISERYRFKWRDALHLVPTLILFIYLLPIYLLPDNEKLFMMFNREENAFTPIVVIVIAKFASLITYAVLIYGVYKRTTQKEDKVDPQILHWQRNLMLLNCAYVFGYFIFVIGRLKLFSAEAAIYPQIFLMSFIILYVGYIAYVQPRVFSKKFLFGEKTLAKYQKSGLTSSFSIELKEQLLILFTEEKIYRQSNISLGILAQRLGTTRHNVSQVINEHFELNFFHLVNRYRIAEAKEILKNDSERTLNIIDVAYDVGFSNKVTFNKAFKTEVNMTPSSYVRSLILTCPT